MRLAWCCCLSATQQALLNTTEAGPNISERAATNQVLVADGETAVRLCRELRPDVVSLDLMLAREMTGLDVTEHIMAYCPTPIVIVSASFNRGELVQTFEAEWGKVHE